MDNLLGNVVGITLTLIFCLSLVKLKDVILHPFPNHKK